MHLCYPGDISPEKKTPQYWQRGKDIEFFCRQFKAWKVFNHCLCYAACNTALNPTVIYQDCNIKKMYWYSIPSTCRDFENWKKYTCSCNAANGEWKGFMLAQLTYLLFQCGTGRHDHPSTAPRGWLDAWLMIRRHGGLSKVACKYASDWISPRGMSSLITVCHLQNSACACAF